MEKLQLIILAIPLLWARIAGACQCEVALSPCSEVGVSDLIFVGTVESIEPSFLNRWNVSHRTSMSALSGAFTAASQNPSVASLAKLKDEYLKIFPDLPPDQKQKFQSASTAN